MSRSKDQNIKSKYNTVPTEEDWGDYRSDLDAEYAHGVFAGHTNEEMQPRFCDNVIERTDDLRFMPEIPFRYYMFGFRDAVLARDFQHGYESDAASCFLRLIAEKLESHPRYIMPIMPELFAAIEHVAHNQARYDADVSIYGNFVEQQKRIQELYERCGGRAYSDQLNAFFAQVALGILQSR